MRQKYEIVQTLQCLQYIQEKKNNNKRREVKEREYRNKSKKKKGNFANKKLS